MPSRKERIPVVLDTNVIIAFYLSRHPTSVNSQVFRLWRDQKKLQLIVGDEVRSEYLEVLNRYGVAKPRVQRFTRRLELRETVTQVSLGPRFMESRDPDDNLMLATAAAGNAKFLITNDRDLLDISNSRRRKFKFQIVTPPQFLAALD